MGENTGYKIKSIRDMAIPTDFENKPKSEPIHNLPFDKLLPFKQHPFKLYDAERLIDMTESIKSNGVIVPIIVRPLDDLSYEILSGHNRAEAAKAVGLDTIPAIVREGLTDEEAMLVVTETNLLQRSFSDLLHSERAVTLSMHHEALKKQGKRTDLIEDIENMVNASNIEDSETSSPMGMKLDSKKNIGERYDLSSRTVARYLRVNKLIQPHKSRLDNNELSVRAGVTLSYLSAEQQQIVDDILCASHYKVDMKKAEILRTTAEKKALTHEDVEQILAGNKRNTSKQRISAFKIKPKILSKYFKPDEKSDEIESVIIKALELYYKNLTETEADVIGDEIPVYEPGGEADVSESDSG